MAASVDSQCGQAILEQDSFFMNILTSGSSLHPTFLYILDGAFAFLLLVLLSLAFFTSGNIHILVLMTIASALWLSIKWFVKELRAATLDKEAKTD